jgi:hypothetical protein
MKTKAPATRRLKILKPVTYALEDLEPGRLVVVDADTAARWITAELAVETTEPLALWPTCQKCGATFPIPERPEPGARWVQCANPRCGHGWMR